MQLLIALIAGVLFGLGLTISGMTDPQRVLGFLDVAGDWDPTLAFVMGGALLVTLPAFQWLPKRGAPLTGGRFHIPTRRDLDGRLLGGSAIFGLGWGLAGLCPGPALTGLVSGVPEVAAFVLAMLAGQWLEHALLERAPSAAMTTPR